MDDQEYYKHIDSLASQIQIGKTRPRTWAMRLLGAGVMVGAMVGSAITGSWAGSWDLDLQTALKRLLLGAPLASLLALSGYLLPSRSSDAGTPRIYRAELLLFCLGALFGAWVAGWIPLADDHGVYVTSLDSRVLWRALLGVLVGGGLGAIPGVTACLRARAPLEGGTLVATKSDKPYTRERLFRDVRLFALCLLLTPFALAALALVSLLLAFLRVHIVP